MKPISLDDKPKKAFDVSASISAESLYLVRGNDAFELGSIEAFIWKHCTGTNSIDDLISLTLEEFDAERPEAEADLLEFVSQLVEEKLLELI